MALGSLQAAGQIRAPSGPAVRPVAFSLLEGGFQCDIHRTRARARVRVCRLYYL